MNSIEVDFQVWQRLTSLRKDESHSYNDVLRELLGLEARKSGDIAKPRTDSQESSQPTKVKGFYSRGLHLPDGTQLRATYKGKPHYAAIKGTEWIDEEGNPHSSPSAAAGTITKNSVNGKEFWEALRPQDTKWRRLKHIEKL